MNKDVLIEARNLRKYFSFGRGGKVLKAVDDVSFEVRKGECFALVGESGSGKTTTARLLNHLHSLTGGEILYRDVPISVGIDALKEKRNSLPRDNKEERKRLSEAIRAGKKINKDFNNLLADALYEREKEIQGDHPSKKGLFGRVQMVFQDPLASLDPRMTVMELVGEGLRIEGHHAREDIRKKTLLALKAVGLSEEMGNRYPHELSGGQRQRVGIARALVMEPEVLIADEIVSALDVSIQAQIINLLQDLRERYGLTIILIAHNLALVRYFADRIAVMHRGKIVEMGETASLFEDPRHPYTKRLLSSVPEANPNRRNIGQEATTYENIPEERGTMRLVAPEHLVLVPDEGESHGKEE